MQQQRTFDFNAVEQQGNSREEESVSVATEPEAPQEQPSPNGTTELDTNTASPRPLLRPDRQIVYPDAITHYDWPDASELHDRDTITIDRIIDDPEDGPAHRFFIKRGDTVRACMANNKFHTGEVIGISHAEKKVRVAWNDTKERGGWWNVGAICPALGPEPEQPTNSKPLAEIVEEVNQQHKPDGGFTEADRVPHSEPYTFAEFKELHKKHGRHGSFADYQSDFERIVSSKDELLTEVTSNRNANQLKALASRFGDWNARNNTKQKNAESIYSKMLTFFLLKDFVSVDMEESYADVVVRTVRAVTEETWKEHFAHIDEKQKEHEAAIENPQTLYDFAKFIEAKSVDAMTNEQMALWDSFHADLARERREQNGPSNVVAQFEAQDLHGIEFQIVEGYHTKRECKLWIVQLSGRVERATFKELNGKAKMLGGRYSSFIKADAGFQFFDANSAAKFTELLGGNADRTDILEARKERRELSASERLHELADTVTARSDESIAASENSLQNTARRADIQAGVRGRAYADQALARSLHSVATALSTGKAKYLDGIRHKTHLETLDTVLYLAKWARIRQIRKAQNEGECGYGISVRDEEEKPYSDDDIRFAEYPHPYVYKTNLRGAISSCKNQRGVKQSAAKMEKLMRRASGDSIDITNEYDIAAYADFLSRAKSTGYDTQWMDAGLEKYKRLRATKIDDLHELRAALREYLPHKASVRGDDPVQIAERELIGKKLPGFFPTPRPVIEQMLEYADIEPHHQVLEPSAGKGDVVTAITAAYPDVHITAIEKNRTLSDVLAAKGIEVEFTDFLTHQGSYDKIIQNPPFEQGTNSEVDHVRHAYDLLAPEGRLVSVMSAGPFFRCDKKSVEFRHWFEDLAGESYELPDNAFNTTEAFRQTGVKTRAIVIDKK